MRDVDRVQFGGAHATPEMTSHAATRATALVRRAIVAGAAMLLVVSAGGCDLAASGLRPASDPGGNDVFVELLKAQGVDVSTLGSSLATMPLPHAGEVALWCSWTPTGPSSRCPPRAT